MQNSPEHNPIQNRRIPVLGFCRGMQMLAVISGAEIIQDLPAYFAEHGWKYNDELCNQPADPDSYRDYASHDIQIVPDSFLFDMFATDALTGCPSWHHQAVKMWTVRA